jgi:hypothetical protein
VTVPNLANLAISTVATAPSPASSGTTLIVASGEGSRFPTVPFQITVFPSNAGYPTPANAEILTVTARATDTLTLVRAQEGTSARSIVAGDVVIATVTKKVLEDIASVPLTPVLFSGCKATRSSDQAISATTSTAILWDTEEYDTDNYHSTSTNTSRLTVPATGKYKITGNLRFGAGEAGFVTIRKNGDTSGGILAQSAVAPATQATDAFNAASLSVEAQLSIGDYVELVVFTNTASDVKGGATGGYGQASLSIARMDVSAVGGTDPLAARVYNNANISVPDSAATALTFNSERFDTGGFHSTSANTNRLTIPETGYYMIGAGVEFSANGTGDRIVTIRNSAGVSVVSESAGPATASQNTRLSPSTYIYALAGEWFEVAVFQASGGALNVLYTAERSPEFWIVKLPTDRPGTSFSGASVTRNADKSITGGADTAVDFDTEEFDTGSYHDISTNNTRLTVPASGKYEVTYSVSRSGAGELAAYIRKNGSGSSRFGVNYFSGSLINAVGTATLDLAAGDYVELVVFATGSFTLDCTSNNKTRFQIRREDGAVSSSSLVRSVTQASHGFVVGDVVRHNGSSYVKAQADSVGNAEVVGIVAGVPDANTFTLLTQGYVSGLSGLAAGSVYYLSASSAGALTATEPSGVGQVSKPVLIALSATEGVFLNMRGAVVASDFGDDESLTLAVSEVNV